MLAALALSLALDSRAPDRSERACAPGAVATLVEWTQRDGRGARGRQRRHRLRLCTPAPVLLTAPVRDR